MNITSSNSSSTSSSSPASIRRRPRDSSERLFDRLRAQGLTALQSLAGERWTDHNLHDPGITLLEQLCFALTDLAYRADFAVADHLSGADGRIDYSALSLHPPAEVFPCRATTADDLRRVLLDAVPGLDDASFETGPMRVTQSLAAATATDLASASALPGLYHLTLKLSPDASRSAAQRIAEARAAYRRERNLCEDLADEVICVRDVPVELIGEIELEGPRDALDVLAEVYDRCARFVARIPSRLGFDEALRAGQTLAQIFSGPRTRHGTLVSAEGEPSGADRLFLADLSTLVQRIDGVAQTRLEALRCPAPELQGDGEPQPGQNLRSLPWRGSDWALRLRVPDDLGAAHQGRRGSANDTTNDSPNGTANATAPATVNAARRAGDPRPTIGPFQSLSVKRRGHPVAIDAQALRLRYADLKAGDPAQHAQIDDEPARRAEALLPRGVHRPSTPYRSVQHDFPAAYGLGRHGLPASAPPQERARVRQFKAYLRLFDQVLANGQAQLDHLRALFSLNGGAAQSYWQQGVDAGDVHSQAHQAHQADLWLADPGAVLKAVHAPFDRGTERKSRALDHLLALHGVTYRQDSMRQFASHLDADETDAWLLQNKAHYLRDIVALARDRAGGCDPSRSCWEAPQNGAGLQRRASLLLGFKSAPARPLTQSLRRQRISLQSGSEPAGQALDAAQIAALRPAEHVPSAARRDEAQDDLRRITVLRAGPLAPTLLRAGLRRECYVLRDLGRAPHNAPADGMATRRPTGAAQGSAAGHATGHQPVKQAACQLWLGPDDDGRWWRLGEFADAARASRAADSLRRFLRHLNDDCEGLHVVEHVLLRPVGPARAAPNSSSSNLQRLPPPNPEFFGLRLSVLLPGWTLRTADAGFRRFTEETLRINTPAHLTLDCHWLDFDAMQRFEDDFGRWMQAKAAHCRAIDDAAPHASSSDKTHGEEPGEQDEHAAALDQASAAVIGHLRQAASPKAKPRQNANRNATEGDSHA